MEFEYKAKDQSGRTVTGVLEAPDEDVLADLLDEKSLFLVDAGPATKQESGARMFERIRGRDVL